MMEKNEKSDKSNSPFVWMIYILVLIPNIAALTLLILNPSIPTTPGWGIRGFPAAMSLSVGFLAALILNRYPQHLIGKLFASLALVSAVQSFSQEYSFYAIYANTSSPGGEYAAWIVNWIWVMVMLILILILIQFPDGKLPNSSLFWKFMIRFGIVNFSLMILSMMFFPGPLDSSISSVENPFGIESLSGFINIVFILTNVGFVLLMIAGFSALITRYRNSGSKQRQQLKWFLYAVAILALSSPTAGLDFPWHLAFMLAILFLPIAAGIAILRYRLYDIDILIRRTLQYTILTGLLVSVYFGGVIILQAILRGISNQADSPIVVVLSTLGIAALFNPLRERTQEFIDRRFFRAKYDAQQTLARFAITARDEVDMDQLGAELITVVDETMQPTNISLMIFHKDRL